MWQATGVLYPYDDPVTLAWDNGPVDWSPGTLMRVKFDIAEGVTVGYTPTGPFHPLALDDERTVLVWLVQRGMKITGETPTWPVPDYPEGVVF